LPADRAEPRGRIRGVGLVTFGTLATAGLWWTGPIPGDRDWPVHYLRGYVVAWVAYVCAAWLVRNRGSARWGLAWIVAVAVALRVVAFARTPRPSTDVYRYLWDGRVVTAGINPYQYAPDARQLAHLQDKHWREIGFKDIPTIYPPAAQLLFAGLSRVSSTDPDVFRLAFAGFDVGVVLLLIALLRRTGRAPEQVIWYAWCPLAATESAAGGHVDVAGVFLLALAFLLAARARGRPGCGSALALAAAVMTKGFALLAAPFFIRRGGLKFAGWFALGCVVLAAPFVGAGRHLFDGLIAYLSAWKVNASLFVLADWLLEHVTPSHYQITRLGSLVAILLVTVWLLWRQRPGIGGLIAGASLALGAMLVLGAPTLPWYVIWTVPALCWWSAPGWVLLTFTVAAQYYGQWLWHGSPHALLWAGYMPVYCLLVWQAAARWGRPHVRGPMRQAPLDMPRGRQGRPALQGGGSPSKQAEGSEQDGGAGAEGGDEGAGDL